MPEHQKFNLNKNLNKVNQNRAGRGDVTQPEEESPCDLKLVEFYSKFAYVFFMNLMSHGSFIQKKFVFSEVQTILGQ